MTNSRRKEGDETWNRLLMWTKSQKASERLAGHILASEGFKSIDPSHPLGGKDGLKDIICEKEDIKWVVAAYFARGEKNFNDVKKKYLLDLKGCKKNEALGFVFITNQYLTLSQRNDLKKSSSVKQLEIYHIERLTHILNTHVNYGIRLEFLDIEMSKEEQLSFFSSVKNEVRELRQNFSRFTQKIKKYSEISFVHEELDMIENRMNDISFMIPLSNVSSSIKDTEKELDQIEYRLNNISIINPLFNLSYNLDEIADKINQIENGLAILSIRDLSQLDIQLERIVENIDRINQSNIKDI